MIQMDITAIPERAGSGLMQTGPAAHHAANNSSECYRDNTLP